MKKSLDLIHETIRSVKHPFQRTETRPNKCQKHRYERRKVKEYIRLTDWENEAGEEAFLGSVQSLVMRLT